MTFIDPMHDNLTGDPTPVGGTRLPQAAPPPGPALPDYAPYGGANMTGLAPGSSGYVSSRLAGEAAAKGEAQTDFDRRAEDQMAQDRQKMAQSYDLEAADARDPALRPWNAEQEKAKYIRGPMENFGSVGMIFAMAASAFTRTPMISALNAGAAAMQATQQSDEKAYKQAFDAWKSNSDLALKRFDMERNLYEDANKLLTTDMNLWKQKSLMLAAQFDNQKMRIMLENGMDKEVLDAQAAQVKAAEEMRKSKFEFEKQDFFRQQYADSIKEYQDAHPGVNDKNKTPEYVAFKAKAWSDALRASQGEMTPEQLAQLRATSAGGNTNLTADRQRAADVDKIMKEKEAAGELKGKSAEQIADIRAKEEARLKSLGTPITSSRKDDLASAITRAQLSSDTINNIESLLKKHIALTGLGGKITRPAEAIGNVFGSNATDRAQFLSLISELKEWAPRLLNESKARPLASEEKEIANIVPGLNIGDTTKNTADRLLKLQKLFRQLQENMTKRYEGTWQPPAAGSTSPPPATTSPGRKPSYLDAPVTP
jgi:hypothetical protein